MQRLAYHRGKVRGYKCFWYSELEEHTNKQDRFRRRAEFTKRQSDIVAWRKQAGKVKKVVLEKNVNLSKTSFHT